MRDNHNSAANLSLQLFTRNVSIDTNPVDKYMFKVSNRNTRKRCEIYSKLTVMTSERRHGICLPGMSMLNLLPQCITIKIEV